MAKLTVALSDPSAVAQLRKLIEDVLVEQGRLSVQIRNSLHAEAQKLDVHSEDAERIIEEVQSLPHIQTAFAEAARRAAREVWLEFKGIQISSFVLIVDASQSAYDNCTAIHRYVSSLIQGLQPLASLQMFFLGNSEPYEAAQFESQGSTWLSENSRRASLITPVFTALQNSGWAQNPSPILVFGAGRIFDIEDWQDTPLVEASRFFPMGDYLTDCLYPEEAAPVEYLVTSLCPTISEVSLGGEGAVPIFWDSSAYHWEQDRLRYTSAANGEPSTPAVRVRWLCAAGAMPQATVTLQNGASSLHQMIPCAPAQDKWRWRSLTREEADHLRQQLDHPASNGDGTKYASLRGKRGIILLRDSEKGASYCHLRCPALRLGDRSSVALWNKVTRRAEIFRLENGYWCHSGAYLPPFYQVSEKTYAVVL